MAGYAMCVSSDVVHTPKSGQTKLDHLPGQPMQTKFASNSVVASQDYSCNTNNACPTYVFMLFNVVRLLLN